MHRGKGKGGTFCRFFFVDDLDEILKNIQLEAVSTENDLHSLHSGQNLKALLLTGPAPRTNGCARRRLVCPSPRDNPHSITAAALRQFPRISPAFIEKSGAGWHHQHHQHHHPPASSTAVSPPPPPLQDESSLPWPPSASQPRRRAL